MNQLNTVVERDVASTSGVFDMKLEVVTIPVSNVERAKQFYSKLGWRFDAEFVKDDAFHLVQFTPPGSACSIHIGKGITPAAPGSARGLYVIVSNIESARAALVARGIAVSEFFHFFPGDDSPAPGLDPARRTYASFATVSDPDGNEWLLQEVTSRLPGRMDTSQATFSTVTDLAQALRRAESAHGEHEKRLGGQRDAEWPAWYAEYLLAEQTGKPLPT